MSVRRAKFTDIPRLVELLQEAHRRTRYADTKVRVDVTHSKGILMGAIQRHDGKGEGSTYVLVSEREGVIEGLIIGVASRIQEFGDLLYVADLVFYQSKRAIPADARLLLQGVKDWAKDLPKVFEITIGATDVIGDYDRTAKLYRRMGFEKCGEMFRMRVG